MKIVVFSQEDHLQMETGHLYFVLGHSPSKWCGPIKHFPGHWHLMLGDPAIVVCKLFGHYGTVLMSWLSLTQRLSSRSHTCVSIRTLVEMKWQPHAIASNCGLDDRCMAEVVRYGQSNFKNRFLLPDLMVWFFARVQITMEMTSQPPVEKRKMLQRNSCGWFQMVCWRVLESDDSNNFCM